jgi:hypothetical protein
MAVIFTFTMEITEEQAVILLDSVDSTDYLGRSPYMAEVQRQAKDALLKMLAEIAKARLDQKVGEEEMELEGLDAMSE